MACTTEPLPFAACKAPYVKTSEDTSFPLKKQTTVKGSRHLAREKVLQVLANFWQQVQTHEIMLHIIQPLCINVSATIFAYARIIQQYHTSLTAPLYSLCRRQK